MMDVEGTEEQLETAGVLYGSQFGIGIDRFNFRRWDSDTHVPQ
jgi:hypothetical protein